MRKVISSVSPGGNCTCWKRGLTSVARLSIVTPRPKFDGPMHLPPGNLPLVRPAKPAALRRRCGCFLLWLAALALLGGRGMSQLPSSDGLGGAGQGGVSGRSAQRLRQPATDAIPAGLVAASGDQSVILHWSVRSREPEVGYNVYRALAPAGPFERQNRMPLTSPGFCDLLVRNGQRYYYFVTGQRALQPESGPTLKVVGAPAAFADENAFLEYVQQANFDYFWYGANPANGLIPDRSTATSPCSIAAVGFGLTAIGIGIDHGWISRPAGAARVLQTLTTFLCGPQGTNESGMMGYKGWFYHFLDMNTARRAPGAELSSIDTAWLLAGVLSAKQYFGGTTATEVGIRALADRLWNRVDWQWMARGGTAVSMGWFPPGRFLASTWGGYNEGMMLYLLGLGAATNPLPGAAWQEWVRGYHWTTNYGQSLVSFAPLFGHQYSHCWVDFRHQADAYMCRHDSTYFENSRRATLAQLAYCQANPCGWPGYGSRLWGLTACDDPYSGYLAHGAPPAYNDNGTLAPTALLGSVAFTPEYSVPAARYLYQNFRTNLWTANGFRDAFNLRGRPWFDPDVLGIDQGPAVIMIENYRTERPWSRFMQNPEIQRGLARAGFQPWPDPRRQASAPSPQDR